MSEHELSYQVVFLLPLFSSSAALMSTISNFVMNPMNNITTKDYKYGSNAHCHKYNLWFQCNLLTAQEAIVLKFAACRDYRSAHNFIKNDRALYFQINLMNLLHFCNLAHHTHTNSNVKYSNVEIDLCRIVY